MSFVLSDLFLISPIIIIFAIPIIAMAVAVFFPRSDFSFGISLLGFVLAVISAAIHLNDPSVQFARFFVSDSFIRVSQIGLTVASIFVSIFSRHWFIDTKERGTDFSILLGISLVGALILVMSNHFLSFFLGLELLSIPTYAMIAHQGKSRRALEASVKYILLAGFFIAILLFGIVLLYWDLGTLEFEGILYQFESSEAGISALTWFGLVLLFCGLAFKVGLAPFHMWLPDVYEGAPTHVTAFLTTVSKGAVLIFFLRFSHFIGVQNLEPLFSLLSVFAVMSMLLGNIMALKQTNLKRLLAYSSVAQVGYVMIAILSSHSNAQVVTLFFIFGYFLAILVALGVLGIYAIKGDDRENIKTLEGLLFSRPLLAMGLTVALLSLTGLPLTVGFLGKLFVLTVGMEQLPIAITLVVSSAIGFYAYFKVILLMVNRGATTILPEDRRWSLASTSVVMLCVFVVILGIVPDLLLSLIQRG